MARLNVTSPDLFWLVFRYVNRGPTSVNGRVSVREEGRLSSCVNCEWSLLAHSFPPRVPPLHSIRRWTQTVASSSWPSTLWEVCISWGTYNQGSRDGLRAEPSRLTLLTSGTEQSQPVTFPPSTEPAFVTVPQRGFGEPFVLNPGIWTLLVEAEGVLLVRLGPQQGGGRVKAGPGPQGLSTQLPSLPGLCGPAAQHLLRGCSPPASSN